MSEMTRSLRRTLLGFRERTRKDRLALPPLAGPDREIVQARNVLACSSKFNSTNPAGYQTIKVHGVTLQGQRDPAARLALTNHDFRGKRVVDFGANRGGMLHAMDGQLRWGVGLEINPQSVNAANRIAAIREDSTLRFYTFDLDNYPLDAIGDLLPEPSADVTFLLAICMWLARWQEVVSFAAKLAPEMFFEANGSDAEQAAQIDYLRATFNTVVQLSEQSDDDATQKRRKSFWCSRSR